MFLHRPYVEMKTLSYINWASELFLAYKVGSDFQIELTVREEVGGGLNLKENLVNQKQLYINF